MTKIPAKTYRCAIYTRVSTEHGLEQEFNSLHAQREAAEAYIKSQAHEGWRLAPGHFDDGGFSGGTTNRPGLQNLLTAIREKRIDIIVVYKVDRLTRSLSDFANLVELFDAQGVSFVSVTQAFNTTNSMGRLTLNVLLSFAQFEREVTGERIRDKIAASKRKGIWMGGSVPLGYEVVERKLVPHLDEAERVGDIFTRYLQLGSLDRLLADLRVRKIMTKRTRLKDGKSKGGIPFAKHSLAHLLKNRIYLGELGHRGKYVPGEHPALIDSKTFDSVQALLAVNSHRRRRVGLGPEFRLTGKIFDDRGNRMSPTATRRRNAYYRYYISTARTQGRKHEAGSVWRVSAPEIERIVTAALGSATSDGGYPSEVEKVTIRPIGIEVVRTHTAPHDRIVQIPWTPTPRSATKGIAFNPDETLPNGRPDRAIEAIATARRCLQQIVAGEIRSLEDLSQRQGITVRSARMQLALAFLGPTIVRDLVSGVHPTRQTCELARSSIVW